MTSTLCKEENDREIKIEFFQSQKSGKHKYIGALKCTLEELKMQRLEFDVKSERNQQVKGRGKFSQFRVSIRHTFLQYVFGGCNINLAIAVDFTLSNGNPTDKDSLHYFDLNKNEYLQAIKSVGSIL